MINSKEIKLSLAGDEDADSLISQNLFALLIGMVLDQQIPLERAFYAPYLLAKRLGVELTPEAILQTGPEALYKAFTEKPALHRFPIAMADRVLELSRILTTEYDHVEALIDEAQNGQELLKRITGLPGFGIQKAKIFIALCGKQIGLECPGWQDVSLPFSEEGSRLSIADITDKDSLEQVRATKKLLKEQAKNQKNSR